MKMFVAHPVVAITPGLINAPGPPYLQLEIKCPLLRGCQWTGRLEDAQTHLNTCYKFRIPCTLNLNCFIKYSCK